MKTIDEWYADYAVSHQNATNQKIHYICVPLIFFSIVGLLMTIPNSFLLNLGLSNPRIGNWAVIVVIPVLIFYLRMSFSLFLRMLGFSVLCILGNYYLRDLLGGNLQLLYASLTIFVLAWIGQFYGHKVEGKKPSFLKDLQFLLIGPAWVFEKMSK